MAIVVAVDNHQVPRSNPEFPSSTEKLVRDSEAAQAHTSLEGTVAIDWPISGLSVKPDAGMRCT
jgi:hypothetical protein